MFRNSSTPPGVTDPQLTPSELQNKRDSLDVEIRVGNLSNKEELSPAATTTGIILPKLHKH